MIHKAQKFIANRYSKLRKSVPRLGSVFRSHAENVKSKRDHQFADDVAFLMTFYLEKEKADNPDLLNEDAQQMTADMDLKVQNCIRSYSARKGMDYKAAAHEMVRSIKRVKAQYERNLHYLKIKKHFESNPEDRGRLNNEEKQMLIRSNGSHYEDAKEHVEALSIDFNDYNTPLMRNLKASEYLLEKVYGVKPKQPARKERTLPQEQQEDEVTPAAA